MEECQTEFVELDRGRNTTCKINLLGATVVSWRIKKQEQLFISRKAEMIERLPMQGGIKFGFPCPGNWSFGRDIGFTHVIKWHLEKGPDTLENGDVEVVLCLTDTNFTRSMWNYKFRIFYRIMLCPKNLKFSICVMNRSPDYAFTIKPLFKNFLRVPDVRECELTGFYDSSYTDETRLGNFYKETRERVTIDCWTDRDYEQTDSEHVITNVAPRKCLRLQKHNLPDTSIWNPWENKIGRYPDLDDKDFTSFVCIEPGNTYNPILLQPGKSYQACQILHSFKYPIIFSRNRDFRRIFLNA